MLERAVADTTCIQVCYTNDLLNGTFVLGAVLNETPGFLTAHSDSHRFIAGLISERIGPLDLKITRSNLEDDPLCQIIIEALAPLAVKAAEAIALEAADKKD